MQKILIDTDVILDSIFDRKPFSEHSTKILTLCENRIVAGFVTSIMISNIYYILRKTAPHEKVIEKLKLLMKIVDVVLTDKQQVLNALNSGFKDFEDALQNFSAQSGTDIKAIITRNTKDYKLSKLAVMTPQTYLKTFHQ